jgi:[protein-PII] uridylyltransferase
VFDLQTAVAESFGYENTKALRASEALMRRYYWAAKAVTQLNQILILNIEERVHGSQNAPMRPINERFLDRGGFLEIVSDDLYERDPHAILATFLTLQQDNTLKGLSARTLRGLYNARNVMDGPFRRDPVNHQAFMAILREPQGHTRVMRLLNQTSVLGRYLWVFRRIVGQMQHDLFHVYTVDQHILMVVRNVRRFFIPEHAHEYPFCTQLAAEWDKPWLLYVAALFHDVAKGRGGDHSVLGGVEVRRFCKDHDIKGDDARLIEFLVAEHLTMSRVAQKEDLSDPDVIQAFAKRVGNERALTGLYLLTVADIRGTSPKVWNAWKGKLLEDLYRLTLRALGGARPHMDAEIEARKQQAKHTLALYFMPPGVEGPLWKTLDMSYFARHDAPDIAWHTRMLWRHVQTDKPVVSGRLSPVGEGLQVLVYSPDRPDLFARICGYFDRAGFNIQDARVHTTASRYALDTFQILASDNMQFEGVHYRDLIALVETQLAEALTSDKPLHEPGRGRLSRRVKSFPVKPRVSLRPDERAQRWLLSVSASDRSGLLYVIARTLARHHVNVQLAKVSTLGERVEDTFLVTGDALRQDKLQLTLETELLEALA